jgi:hypothetical protein
MDRNVWAGCLTTVMVVNGVRLIFGISPLATGLLFIVVAHCVWLTCVKSPHRPPQIDFIGLTIAVAVSTLALAGAIAIGSMDGAVYVVFSLWLTALAIRSVRLARETIEESNRGAVEEGVATLHRLAAEWEARMRREELAERARAAREAQMRAERREEMRQPDLHALKMAMAAAHPDHGGSSEAFIKARERYLNAKQSAETLDP